MTEPTDQTGPTEGASPAQPPAMPRWVKVSGIVISVLLLVFVILKLTGLGGQHGPGMHQSGAPAVEAAELAGAQSSDVAARFER